MGRKNLDEKVESFKTMDFDKFTYVDSNRNLDKSNLAKLINSIKKNNYLHVMPIIVNEKFEIIDGQHRWKAAKKLKTLLYYIIGEGLTVKDARNMNLVNKNWNSKDFLAHYSKERIRDYIICKRFCEKWKVGIGEAIKLLSGQNRNYAIFNDGAFKATHPKTAAEYMTKIYDFKPYYPTFKRRDFIYSMIMVFTTENYDHKWMLNRLELKRIPILDQAGCTPYLNLLEEIYNHQLHKEKRLRFR